jgi:phage-related baseplate assembly protein
VTFSISNLPEPELIEQLDYETIFRSLMQDFRNRHPEYTALLESDPAVKLLQVFAYRELILRQRVNDAFKATLLAFAEAGDLDHLSAFYGVNRQEPETDEQLRERTIERIKGSSTAGGAAWYRYQTLTADNRVADAQVTSPDAGQVRIAVLSLEGQLIEAATVEQLSAMAELYGLEPREDTPLEPVETFRARVRAGALGTGGDGTASAQLLELLDDHIQGDSVRVITDTVEVVGATIQTVDVEARVWLYPDQAPTILAGLAERIREDFRQSAGLGWDLTPSWLISRLHIQGVQRVELLSPTAVVPADAGTAVALGDFTITLAGYDR